MRDEHCHILWGVDDGSPDWETTCAMVDEARACGFTHIVCTPHMRWDDFDRTVVEARFNQLVAYAPDIEFTLGFEVYYKRLLSMGLEHAPEFTVGDTNTILLEFNSGAVVPHDWERVFYTLQSTYGLDIVLAHPERYSSVLEDFDLAYRMHDAGVRMQVSAGDVLGSRFNKAVRTARRLVSEGLADALVSDAHRPEHYADYRAARKKLKM